MSDAMSQAYQAQLESNRYERFLEALFAFLKTKGQTERGTALFLQKSFAESSRWWRIDRPFRETMESLTEGNPTVWARFFAWHINNGSWFYQLILPEFKKISPFTGKLILVVSTASIRSAGTDLEQLARRLLGDDLLLDSGAEYLVTLPAPAGEKPSEVSGGHAEIFRVRAPQRFSGR